MIEVEGLTKYYGLTRAVYDLSFEIESGQIVGFLGLNGAGKSTALKILAGFLLPTAGTVRIEGTDLVADPDKLRRRIGFLPEKPPLYDEMTVRGFLNYAGRLRGMPGNSLRSRVDAVAERTAITEKLDQTIGTLSLGFRKRVGIAQAIVHDPALVILDEPIAGLDPIQIVGMRELVRGLRGEHTILISSHILTEVEETCDKLLMLHDGELVAQGTEEELLSRVRSSLRFELTVKGDFDAASELIGGLDIISESSLLSANGDINTFVVTLLRDEPEALARAVVGAGHGLRRLEPARGQLEGVFVELTRPGGGRTKTTEGAA